MFILGVPFLHTISKGYKFRTIHEVKTGEKKNQRHMEKNLKKVVNLYHSRGIEIQQIMLKFRKLFQNTIMELGSSFCFVFRSEFDGIFWFSNDKSPDFHPLTC